MAVEFDNFETNKKIIDLLLDTSTDSPGVFTDWFLFASNCLRIVPPLVISNEQIQTASAKLICILNDKVQ